MNLFECYVCGDPQESKTCDRCQNGIRGLLSALPELYRALEGRRQRAQSGGGDGHSATLLHAPLPGDEQVLNLLGPASRQAVTNARDQTGETPFLALLESWCQALSEERAVDHVKRNVTAMTARLTAHLPWICAQEWVADFAEEIGGLVYAVQKITMTAPKKQPLRGVTCPSCESLTLVRHFPGDWAAECALCPSVRLDDRDYEDLVRSQAAKLKVEG
ncbi:hypothetical protein [Streptomyces mirabilis]|uniref:hypothetical protein n=1 Tax=Streptomyces mirabilis TaxID=68239 RepID=UPI0033AF01A0